MASHCKSSRRFSVCPAGIAITSVRHPELATARCRRILIAILFVAHAVAAQLQFTQGSKLVGIGADGPAQQGSSVAISADGNTAIVGGPRDDCSNQGCVGAAWVYTRSAGLWSQQGAKLVGTGAVGGAYQGSAVGISADGNTVVVGGPGDDSSTGAAWVFTRSGGIWSQQGNKLVGGGFVGDAQQGASVAVSGDGNTAIVGGPYDDPATGAVPYGAAWIFARSAGVWSQQGGKLVGSDNGGPGWEGYSVAISSDGNTAIVGAPWDATELGAAWVYTRSGGVWSQQGNKLIDTAAVRPSFQGWSVAISADGNTAILGGAGDSSSVGAAWVYVRSGGVWSQQGSKLIGSGGAGETLQGWSVALSADGNHAIVGGVADNLTTGAAWMYARSGVAWSQLGSKLVGTGTGQFQWQGYAVSISGDGTTAIVGGAGEDSNTGSAWVFNGGTCAAPTIASQPQSEDIQSGQSTSLAVTSTGTPPLSYQWYQGTAGDTSQPLGANASSFTTPVLWATTSFWVRVSNGCGHSDSTTATVQAESIVAQPGLAPPRQQFVLDFGIQSSNGPSASLSEPVTTALDPGSTFTIEFWLFLETPSPNQKLLGRWLDNDADFLYAFYFDPSGTALVLGQNSGTGGRRSTAAATIPLRTWTHIAGTLDGSTLKLLVNGSVVSAVSSAGAPATGVSSAYQFGPGSLAAFRQVRVWSRALTPAEITNVARQYIDPTTSGLVAEWPMDDGPGMTVRDLGSNHGGVLMPVDYATNPLFPRWIRTTILDSGPYFTFEPLTTASTVAVAGFIDFNSDGFPDILGVENSDPLPGNMSAFVNDGHGHFSDATTSVFGGTVPQMTHTLAYFPVADFDGDGRMDCFITGTGPEALGATGTQSRILVQKPGGVLADETSSRIPIQNTFTHSVTVGDIDGNASVDIFMGNLSNTTTIGPRFYMNDGTGHFTQDTTRTPPEVANLSLGVTSSLLVDLNGDGRPELVLGKYAGLYAQDGLLPNDGTGHFAFAPYEALPLRCGGPDWTTVSIASADFDRDGWPDLLAASYSNGLTSTCFQLLLNNRNGTFRDATDRIPPQNWAVGGYLHEVEAVDLNGDGWVDFIVHGNAAAESRVYVNRGGAYFVDATDLLPMKGGFGSFHAGDVDNDGKRDLLVTEGINSFFVLRQLKAFDPAITMTFDPNGDSQVTVADVFYLINQLFAAGPPLLGPGDSNGDGAVTSADVVFLINYLFAGGPLPH